MDYIPPYLNSFISKVLNGECFLSYTDDSGVEWVNVFESIDTRSSDYKKSKLQFDNFYKNIFSELGLSPDKVELKPIKSVYYRKNFDSDKDYENAEAKMILESLGLDSSKPYEKAHREDPDILDISRDGIMASHVRKSDFEKLKTSVVDMFGEGKDEEFDKPSFLFNKDLSILFFGNKFCKIPKHMNNGANFSYQNLILDYFYGDLPPGPISWEDLHNKAIEWLAGEDKKDAQANRRITDAINAINKTTKKSFGVDCLDWEKDALQKNLKPVNLVSQQ
jgi:hypothetical protein